MVSGVHAKSVRMSKGLTYYGVYAKYGISKSGLQTIENNPQKALFAISNNLAYVYGMRLSELFCLPKSKLAVPLTGPTGWRLRNARQLKRISIREASEAVGIPQYLLSQGERGHSYLRLGVMIALSELYGVSVDDLVGDELESFTPPH